MAHLSLPNSEFHVGVSFPFEPGPRTAVLFPGEGALPPEVLAEGDPWTLVVVDGTWSQARKIVRQDPALAGLPRIGFVPERPGNYRIRREPSEECLATVEAVAQVLAKVEGEPERFDSMIEAFNHMVELQLEAARTRGDPGRRRCKLSPPRPDRELLRLREAGERLVLLQAEGNAHPRESAVPGRPELVHVVALRPASGERLELIIAPRRPLAEKAPDRLGLDATLLLGGRPVADAIEELRAFLGEDDVVGTWGVHPARLLATEGVSIDEPLDLRALLSRRLGHRPGPLEEILEAPGAPAGRGRAGRIVSSLALLAELLAKTDDPRPELRGMEEPFTRRAS